MRSYVLQTSICQVVRNTSFHTSKLIIKCDCVNCYKPQSHISFHLVKTICRMLHLLFFVSTSDLRFKRRQAIETRGVKFKTRIIFHLRQDMSLYLVMIQTHKAKQQEICMVEKMLQGLNMVLKYCISISHFVE